MYHFTTILIPVDFTVNTEVAVTKAVALAGVEPVTIHLMHVQNALRFARRQRTTDEAEWMLRQWKQTVEDYLPAALVHCHLMADVLLQTAIAEAAARLGADLVIIGKNKAPRWLGWFTAVRPERIAAQVSVLTVRPGALHSRLRTVVVPLTEGLPQHKLEALEVLCRQSKPSVHLITYVNGSRGPSEFSASTLLKVYQWLKARLHCPVEYAVVHGDNKASAILNYAERNGADVLLVNAPNETRLSWPGLHLTEVLPSSSKMQVLSVRPAPLF